MMIVFRITANCAHVKLRKPTQMNADEIRIDGIVINTQIDTHLDTHLRSLAALGVQAEDPRNKFLESFLETSALPDACAARVKHNFVRATISAFQ